MSSMMMCRIQRCSVCNCALQYSNSWA